jgi:hypothetical protein
MRLARCQNFQVVGISVSLERENPAPGGERGFQPTASGDLQGHVAVSVVFKDLLRRSGDETPKSNNVT